MNTKGLARHYEVLTPWERVPLIVAASVRGDAVEADRLMHSAPSAVFQVPNYRGLSEGLQQLALLYLATQLDLAVVFHETLTFLSQEDPILRTPELRTRVDRLGPLTRLLAYRVVINADAWRLLCSQLRIDSEVLLRDLPGYGNLARLEARARDSAFRTEEAVAYLRENAAPAPTDGGPPPVVTEYRVDTATDVVQAWREFLEQQAGAWA